MQFTTEILAVDSAFFESKNPRVLQVAARVVFVLFCLIATAVSASSDTDKDWFPPLKAYVPSAGAASCGSDVVLGSAQFFCQFPIQVGDSINVVNGNMYQYDLDYRSSVSGLTLARHYNSSLSQYNLGLGGGWRHSYDVVLTTVNADRLEILQSDGRRISFNRVPTEQGDIFEASLATDGYIRQGEPSVWYLPDGRRLSFQGSLLIELNLGERSGVLSLAYKDGKLHTVTDHTGASLQFNYGRDTSALPEGSSSSTVPSSGRITSVKIPGDSIINYSYGENDDLLGVEFSDGQIFNYAYDDENWPGYLTQARSSIEERVSEWRYDEKGRAVAWNIVDSAAGLDVERETLLENSLSSSAGERLVTWRYTATVTYSGERKIRYRWTPFDNRDVNPGVMAVDISCDNCKPEAMALQTDKYAALDPSPKENEQGMSNPRPGAAMAKSVFALLADLKVEEQQPPEASGLARYVGVYPHSQKDIPMQLSIDRMGKVRGLSIGGRTLVDWERFLNDFWALTAKGPGLSCSADSSPENDSTFYNDRILALANGEPQCMMDSLILLEFIHYVESYLLIERTGGRDGSLEDMQVAK